MVIICPQAAVILGEKIWFLQVCSEKKHNFPDPMKSQFINRALQKMEIPFGKGVTTCPH